MRIPGNIDNGPRRGWLGFGGVLVHTGVCCATGWQGFDFFFFIVSRTCLQAFSPLQSACDHLWLCADMAVVSLSDFSPDPWSPPERGPDEPDWGKDALHPGVAVPARVWNHPFSCQVRTEVHFRHLDPSLTFIVVNASFLSSAGSRVGSARSWSASPTTVWSGWMPAPGMPSKPGASATWSSGMSTGRSRW